MKKIVCIQSRNDYSGSPLVLNMVIDGFLKKGYKIDLHASNLHEKGFLSEIEGVDRYPYHYQLSRYKLITLFNLFRAQLLLFFRLVNMYRKQDVIFYINAILPFGAALAGKITGKKVICHVHESYLRPLAFKKFLTNIFTWCSHKAIYVSAHLKSLEEFTQVPAYVIHNALPKKFTETAKNFIPDKVHKKAFDVLMASSLKKDKGIFEFIELAYKLPEQNFHLVLSVQQNAIDTFFAKTNLPPNLNIYPVQSCMHHFYEQADVVMNLSHPIRCVESFGLTILEAMNYGCPVVVPPIGGPTELVENGYNGFWIDSSKTNEIVGKLRELAKDTKLYERMSMNAIKKSREFSIDGMQQQINKILIT